MRPPASTGARTTGDAVCVASSCAGRPCAARARRCSSARPTPVLRRLGWYGRYDPFSLDGNHVLRLISLLMVDALRPSIVAIARMPVPLPISIWMTWRSSCDRCEYTAPIGATSFRTGFLDNYQSTGCCTFI